MSIKPLIPRAAARRDVEAAVDFYALEAGIDVASKFVEALETSYRMIASRPATGSPRYSHELDIPGLRSRKLRSFPYYVFYTDSSGHIDVWRVLHARRDMADWLVEPTSTTLAEV